MRPVIVLQANHNKAFGKLSTLARHLSGNYFAAELFLVFCLSSRCEDSAASVLTRDCRRVIWSFLKPSEHLLVLSRTTGSFSSVNLINGERESLPSLPFETDGNDEAWCWALSADEEKLWLVSCARPFVFSFRTNLWRALPLFPWETFISSNQSTCVLYKSSLFICLNAEEDFAFITSTGAPISIPKRPSNVEEEGSKVRIASVMVGSFLIVYESKHHCDMHRVPRTKWKRQRPKLGVDCCQRILCLDLTDSNTLKKGWIALDGPETGFWAFHVHSASFFLRGSTITITDGLVSHYADDETYSTNNTFTYSLNLAELPFVWKSKENRLLRSELDGDESGWGDDYGDSKIRSFSHVLDGDALLQIDSGSVQIEGEKILSVQADREDALDNYDREDNNLYMVRKYSYLM